MVLPARPHGAVLGNYSGVAYTIPVYLRLKRTGNVFNSFYSVDGITWTQMDPTAAGNTEIATNFTATMTDPIYVGLACCAHAAASLATAVFDRPKIAGAQPSPTPADKATGIAYDTTTTLKWDAVPYPDGAIKDWKVYIGTEPNDLTATLLGTVSEPTREITSAGSGFRYDLLLARRCHQCGGSEYLQGLLLVLYDQSGQTGHFRRWTTQIDPGGGQLSRKLYRDGHVGPI